MRPGIRVLAAALVLATTAPLRADEWTLIDVKTRLANDGRVTVVETHSIVLETTGRNTFRDFGRGADQEIRLTAITRLGPDVEAHPLKRVDTVTGPDEYTSYDLGHVYFAIPPLGENVTLQYRFEYELVGGVAPSWAIAAGPGSRAPSDQEFFWPWERIGHIVADWRRAWPALATRYRFDHDVLLPDREGPGHTFRQIDYQLKFDTNWRDIAPSADIGTATHGAFRTAQIFDYLGTDIPPHAATAPAILRLVSLLMVPLIGTIAWALVIVAARVRRGPPIDRTFVDTRFVTHAPEEIAFWFEDKRPVAADVLARLASEGAISVDVDRPAGLPIQESSEYTPLNLRMRRIADARLTAFERSVLDDIFGDAPELTTESHRRRHIGRDYDPDDSVERLLHDAAKVEAGAGKSGARWSPVRAGLMLVFLAAMIGVFRNAGPLFDVVPILGIWAFFTVALVNGWPTGWWYPGRPVRGLLIALVLLSAMQLTMLLIPNRPLPAEGWLASAVAVLAAYMLTLVRSRMTGGEAITDLLRMRAYAQAELRRSRPQLDDRWIPRLRALGLGRAIDAWRVRNSGGAVSLPEHRDRPPITTAHFTGTVPAPWVGPAGWEQALTVYADDEVDDQEEAADHDAAADAAAGRDEDRS
jgi:hypothetical protein